MYIIYKCLSSGMQEVSTPKMCVVLEFKIKKGEVQEITVYIQVY